MSDISVRLDFAGEERTFALRIRELRALQGVCDAGPGELLQRFVAQRYRVDDVRETIRQGLIGGGDTDAIATKLMRDHFDDRPLAQFVILAQAIVAAALLGVEDDPVGEQAAGAGETNPSPAESSGSPSSTD